VRLKLSLAAWPAADEPGGAVVVDRRAADCNVVARAAWVMVKRRAAGPREPETVRFRGQGHARGRLIVLGTMRASL